METELSKAVKILAKHLNDDIDYRKSWQANIAMAVIDQYNRLDPMVQKLNIHAIANTGARHFLDLLCKDALQSSLPSEHEVKGIVRDAFNASHSEVSHE